MELTHNTNTKQPYQDLKWQIIFEIYNRMLTITLCCFVLLKGILNRNMPPYRSAASSMAIGFSIVLMVFHLISFKKKYQHIHSNNSNRPTSSSSSTAAATLFSSSYLVSILARSLAHLVDIALCEIYFSSYDEELGEQQQNLEQPTVFALITTSFCMLSQEFASLPTKKHKILFVVMYLGYLQARMLLTYSSISISMIISVDFSFASIVLIGLIKKTSFQDTLQKRYMVYENNSQFHGGSAGKKKQLENKNQQISLINGETKSKPNQLQKPPQQHKDTLNSSGQQKQSSQLQAQFVKMTSKMIKNRLSSFGNVLDSKKLQKLQSSLIFQEKQSQKHQLKNSNQSYCFFPPAKLNSGYRAQQLQQHQSIPYDNSQHTPEFSSNITLSLLKTQSSHGFLLISNELNITYSNKACQEYFTSCKDTTSDLKTILLTWNILNTNCNTRRELTTTLKGFCSKNVIETPSRSKRITLGQHPACYSQYYTQSSTLKRSQSLGSSSNKGASKQNTLSQTRSRIQSFLANDNLTRNTRFDSTSIQENQANNRCLSPSGNVSVYGLLSPHLAVVQTPRNKSQDMEQFERFDEETNLNQGYLQNDHSIYNQMNKFAGQNGNKLSKDLSKNGISGEQAIHQTSFREIIEDKNRQFDLKYPPKLQLKKVSLLRNDFLISGLRFGMFFSLKELLDVLLNHENYKSQNDVSHRQYWSDQLLNLRKDENCMTDSSFEESAGEDKGKIEPAEYKVEKNLLEIKTKCPNGKLVQVRIKVFAQVQGYQEEDGEEHEEEEMDNKNHRLSNVQGNNYSMCDEDDTIVYDDENDEDGSKQDDSKQPSRIDYVSKRQNQQLKEKYYYQYNYFSSTMRSPEYIVFIEINESSGSYGEVVERAELEKFKTKMMASISHELRTPLNCSIQVLDILTRSDAVSEPVKKMFITPALNSNQLLLSMINDILDFAELQDGNLQLQFSPFELIAVLRECVSYFCLAAAVKNLTIELHIDTAIPNNLHSDQTRLKQVIISLLSNAIKFTQQGCITISVHLETTDLIKITISDTGCGIPSEIASQIFNGLDTTKTQKKTKKTTDNNRSNENTRLNTEGIGLGLAIANNIAKGLGGNRKIEVISNFGEGSAFSFYLVNRAKVTKGCTFNKYKFMDYSFSHWRTLMDNSNQDLTDKDPSKTSIDYSTPSICQKLERKQQQSQQYSQQHSQSGQVQMSSSYLSANIPSSQFGFKNNVNSMQSNQLKEEQYQSPNLGGLQVGLNQYSNNFKQSQQQQGQYPSSNNTSSNTPNDQIFYSRHCNSSEDVHEDLERQFSSRNHKRFSYDKAITTKQKPPPIGYQRPKQVKSDQQNSLNSKQSQSPKRIYSNIDIGDLSQLTLDIQRQLNIENCSVSCQDVFTNQNTFLPQVLKLNLNDTASKNEQLNKNLQQPVSQQQMQKQFLMDSCNISSDSSSFQESQPLDTHGLEIRASERNNRSTKIARGSVHTHPRNHPPLSQSKIPGKNQAISDYSVSKSTLKKQLPLLSKLSKDLDTDEILADVVSFLNENTIAIPSFQTVPDKHFLSNNSIGSQRTGSYVSGSSQLKLKSNQIIKMVSIEYTDTLRSTPSIKDNKKDSKMHGNTSNIQSTRNLLKIISHQQMAMDPISEESQFTFTTPKLTSHHLYSQQDSSSPGIQQSSNKHNVQSFQAQNRSKNNSVSTTTTATQIPRSQQPQFCSNNPNDSFSSSFTPSSPLKKLILQQNEQYSCDCPQILLVDDNEFNLYVLELNLKQYGFKVEKATSGTQAIEMVKSKQQNQLKSNQTNLNDASSSNSPCKNNNPQHNKYFLIFMDIDMPVKNGYETSIEILKYFSDIGESQPSIISACTAFISEQERKLALDAGMKHYLTKPVTIPKLEEVLGKVFK